MLASWKVKSHEHRKSGIPHIMISTLYNVLGYQAGQFTSEISHKYPINILIIYPFPMQNPINIP